MDFSESELRYEEWLQGVVDDLSDRHKKAIRSAKRHRLISIVMMAISLLAVIFTPLLSVSRWETGSVFGISFLTYLLLTWETHIHQRALRDLQAVDPRTIRGMFLIPNLKEKP